MRKGGRRNSSFRLVCTLNRQEFDVAHRQGRENSQIHTAGSAPLCLHQPRWTHSFPVCSASILRQERMENVWRADTMSQSEAKVSVREREGRLRLRHLRWQLPPEVWQSFVEDTRLHGCCRTVSFADISATVSSQPWPVHAHHTNTHPSRDDSSSVNCPPVSSSAVTAWEKEVENRLSCIGRWCGSISETSSQTTSPTSPGSVEGVHCHLCPCNRCSWNYPGHMCHSMFHTQGWL